MKNSSTLQYNLKKIKSLSSNCVFLRTYVLYMMSARVMTVNFIIYDRGAHTSPAFKMTKSKQSAYIINEPTSSSAIPFCGVALVDLQIKHFKECLPIPDGCGIVLLSYCPPPIFISSP